MAAKKKPNWLITFDINPDVTLGLDGQSRHTATATAKHGDLAFVAEIELANWAEDMAAFFDRARSFFFEAEVSGLPDFPDMKIEPEDETPKEPVEQETTSEESTETAEEIAEVPQPEAEIEATGADKDFEIEYYPADVEDVDTNQATLF